MHSKHTLPIAVLSLGLWQGAALADDTLEPASASVQIDGCDGIDVEDLRRGIELERFDRENAIDVFVTCEPNSTVASIHVFSPGGVGERRGTIDFQGIETIAWTRSLALTIAELERTSTQVDRTEHLAMPAPAQPQTTPTPLASPAHTERISEKRLAADLSKTNRQAAARRWWLEAGSSSSSQTWSVASSTTNDVHSNYDFMVLEIGGGFRPFEWLSIGASLAASIGTYSEIDHEANAGLPGELSGPDYDNSALNIDVRPLSWRTLEVHAIAGVSSHDLSGGGRTMDNSIYPLDWLDPVDGEWTEYSGGLRLTWAMRPWLRASAAYEQLQISEMDLGYRGTASGVKGERAAVGLDVALIDGFSLHGNLGFQSARAHSGNIAFGKSNREAALRLRMDM